MYSLIPMKQERLNSAYREILIIDTSWGKFEGRHGKVGSADW